MIPTIWAMLTLGGLAWLPYHVSASTPAMTKWSLIGLCSLWSVPPLYVVHRWGIEKLLELLSLLFQLCLAVFFAYRLCHRTSAFSTFVDAVALWVTFYWSIPDVWKALRAK